MRQRAHIDVFDGCAATHKHIADFRNILKRTQVDGSEGAEIDEEVIINCCYCFEVTQLKVGNPYIGP